MTEYALLFFRELRYGLLKVYSFKLFCDNRHDYLLF